MIGRVFLIILLSLGAQQANALEVTGVSSSEFDSAIKRELSKKFHAARIELSSAIRWVKPASTFGAVTVQQITPRGEAFFTVSSQPMAEGWVVFSAWVPAHIANKRILPGEKISADMFTSQEVNVATGNAYEYRGVIYSDQSKLAGLEARQTVLEGQFLTSTAVQKIPDIRKGDSVRIQLVSGGLTVVTAGIAEEPGNMHGRIKVMTGKSKRELTGELTSPGIVEVRL